MWVRCVSIQDRLQTAIGSRPWISQAAAITNALERTEGATRVLVENTAGAGHLNDSQGALGSNKDRHMLIGEGAIGVAPFGWLLRDRRSAGVPCILETPQENPEIAEDDPSADPWDVRMVELLRALE